MTESLFAECAQLIREADGLLIGAGAGIGVDAGLPDFRGEHGFWKSYPALGRARIPFESLKRHALVIFMRSQKLWLDAVPELAGHRKFYKLRNPLNPVLSLKNLGEEGFKAMCKELRKVAI